MNDPRRLGGLEYILLLVVIAGAAGVRVAYVQSCAAGAAASGPFQVQDAQDSRWTALVEALSRDGAYAVTPDAMSAAASVAHPAPLYLALVAGVRRVTVDMADAERWTRRLQCLLGAGTAALVFLFARRAFHSNVIAFVAGLGAAAHPFWVFGSAEIADGVLTSFLLSLCLLLGARANQSCGALTCWALGLALAGLPLTRAALLPFAIICLLWFLHRCAHFERGWLFATLAFLGFMSGLGPWFVRNYIVFRDVFPVVDDSIHQLWLGNRTHVATTATPEELRMDRPEDDADKLHAIWNELRHRPAAFLERRLWAGLYFWFGEDWFKHGRLSVTHDNGESAPTLPSWLSRSYAALLAGSLLAILILGMHGWRVSYPWRHESTPLTLAIIWIPLPYVLSHAENLSGPRLPLDGVLICYAAYGLVWTVASLGHFIFRRGFGVDVEK